MVYNKDDKQPPRESGKEKHMDFGTNLSNARRAKGMSQEELAERLNVSRQTIYKWETGATYPDIDKLGDIARCLGVSAAYLLGEGGDAPLNEDEEKNTAPDEPAPERGEAPAEKREPVCALEKSEVTGHYKRFARLIGACTLLILVSVGVLVALSGDVPEWRMAVALVQLLCCVAAAVIGYVVAGVQHEAFVRRMVAFPTYDERDREDEQRSFLVRIATGLGLIFAGIVTLVVLGIVWRERFAQLAVGIFLALVGIAVYLFITGGIMHDLYTGESATRQRRAGEEEPWGGVSGVIMLLATAAYLIMGFLFDLWHPGWVIFPVAGILCAIVAAIWKLIRHEK